MTEEREKELRAMAKDRTAWEHSFATDVLECLDAIAEMRRELNLLRSVCAHPTAQTLLNAIVNLEVKP